MKILQVVPYFYPAWSYGGPAKLVYDTSLYFSQKGHSVTVYTSDSYDENNRMPKSFYVKKKNFKVNYFKNFHNLLTYRYNIYFTPGLFLKAIFQIKKFDIIHIHDFYTLQNFWVGFLANLYKIPYIVSVHGCLEEERIVQRSFFKSIYYTVYGSKLLRYASKVVATSKNEIKAYENHEVDKENILFIGHGINPREFRTRKNKADCKKRFNFPEENKVITYLGRIHKIKGLDLLVKSISEIKEDKISFVIAGSDDGYLQKLKDLLNEYNVKEKVTLLPACFGEEKSMLFRASDIFVYPSYSEGFSLGILEAAAAKLPLVITTGCHFPMIKNYNAGLIVNPDHFELKNALLKLIKNNSLRNEYSRNAAMLIDDKYSMSHIGDTILNAYEDLV